MYGRIEHALGADVDRALVRERPLADQGLDRPRGPLLTVVPEERERLGRVSRAREDEAHLVIDPPVSLAGATAFRPQASSVLSGPAR